MTSLDKKRETLKLVEELELEIQQTYDANFSKDYPWVSWSINQIRFAIIHDLAGAGKSIWDKKGKEKQDERS